MLSVRATRRGGCESCGYPELKVVFASLWDLPATT